DIEQHLYRIAEEALNNVVRHANAKNVLVALYQDERCVSLRITDDGIGFDPEHVASEKQYGLTGMRERATLSGGEFEIGSSPQNGTTVQLTIKNTTTKNTTEDPADDKDFDRGRPDRSLRGLARDLERGPKHGRRRRSLRWRAGPGRDPKPQT
ncbi:MAG: hypothetical protein GYB65_15395, partial [Chloroflexi bacterium]|nr:hypothetical protein [Chloroflexota bacterium]